MKKDFVFALARFRRGFDPQELEVVRFGPDAIELKQNGEIKHAIAYKDLEKLVFIQANRLFPQVLSFLEMEGLSSKSSQFEIQTEEKNFRLTLGEGLRYQNGLLQQLFTLLYRKGVPLKEQTQAGIRLFLLEKMPQEDVEKAIALLKSESKGED